jgi:hypothetical protein
MPKSFTNAIQSSAIVHAHSATTLYITREYRQHKHPSTSSPGMGSRNFEPGSAVPTSGGNHRSESTVGYLEIDAQQNIELRSEMQTNWCSLSAETRQLRQDFCRVSAECRELRKTANDLIQYRKWEELRRQCEEEDRRGWDNVLNERIAAAEQCVREQVSQLRAGLCDEIDIGLGQNVDDVELRNTPSPTSMEVEKPTIEEFVGQLKSTGGLEESQHAPKNSSVHNGTPTNPSDTSKNSQDPPTGPKKWRERIARNHRRSRQSKMAKKNVPTRNTKLQQLEADILELKESIRQQETARKESDTHDSRQCNGNEWKAAKPKRPANRKTQSLRIQGKYKLVIGSSDDGTRADITTIQKEIERTEC